MEQCKYVPECAGETREAENMMIVGLDNDVLGKSTHVLFGTKPGAATIPITYMLEAQ